MCFEITQYREYSCTHRQQITSQRVDCNDRKCRLSQLHGQQSHNCQAVCKQA
ncbi:hypothetical protein BD410DRAFT_720045 [Rickenella mellea]|uniref:Uncharacterized protein n=1 Tax=Rickenella mellea TaxID=50990 RepID=A0A4Y7Q8X1_9AGAM|nr:hypothetical protein BD410DRAFT_720045 [Rickenella mellea]